MEKQSMIRKCRICGESGHNKKTCPNKPVEDTFVREIIEETIEISDKKEKFIHDLLDRDAYTIDDNLFIQWLQLHKPVPLKEIRYLLDKGLQKPSVILYLNMVNDIDEFY